MARQVEGEPVRAIAARLVAGEVRHLDDEQAGGREHPPRALEVASRVGHVLERRPEGHDVERSVGEGRVGEPAREDPPGAEVPLGRRRRARADLDAPPVPPLGVERAEEEAGPAADVEDAAPFRPVAPDERRLLALRPLDSRLIGLRALAPVLVGVEARQVGFGRGRPRHAEAAPATPADLEKVVDQPEFTKDDTLHVKFGPNAPVALLFDDPSADVQDLLLTSSQEGSLLRVESGSLELTSRAVPAENVTVLAGQCLLRDSSVVGEHAFLGSLSAGTCP